MPVELKNSVGPAVVETFALINERIKSASPNPPQATHFTSSSSRSSNSSLTAQSSWTRGPDTRRGASLFAGLDRLRQAKSTWITPDALD
jgi:hypothetical protein